MKILFSADWHIKLGQKNVPREWQVNRFQRFYSMIHDLSPKVDMHIIGGDIFDTIPSLSELALFALFLEGVNIPTYIFDGNHEATRKGKTFLSILKPVIERLQDRVTVLEGIQELEGVDIIPYTHIKTFNPEDFHHSILFTHVRGNIPPHVKAEIDLDKLKHWELVIAGDLHSHTNSQANIVYPGSPMTVTFHRNVTNTGVLIVDTEDISYRWSSFVLPQLLRKTVETEEEMIATQFDHTIYEITGNIDELSGVKKTNPLLDKKIVKRVVESKLNFSKLETVEDELLAYFNEVKGLTNTDKIIKRYNDYI